MSGQADGRMGRKRRGRSGGRGRKGCGRADGAHEAWTRGRAEEARTGPRRRGRADWAVGGERAAVERTGRTGRTGSPPIERTSERAGGPRFKRPHSTRLGSLLGAQSACLVRARVRKVPGSAVGSSTIPRQTPVLSARTHFPRLNASVLDAEKGILLFRYRNGFTQGRWQRIAKSTASSSCTMWVRGKIHGLGLYYTLSLSSGAAG